jgi:hypothetical protein
MMETKEENNKRRVPLIIANPIYDTVFKRLMENLRIAKFFLSTILERQIEDVTFLPQEFTYKKPLNMSDGKGVEDKKMEELYELYERYSIFRLDFAANVRTADGKRQKILIEVQKSLDIIDVGRFRQYLGEQYTRKEVVDGKEQHVPITTIYILGSELPDTDCPCFQAGRNPYRNLVDKTTFEGRIKFVELVTHDCYVIQASKITDLRCTTNMTKLLSVFEQRYFVKADSKVTKEYYYYPDDENIALITDILYEMGASSTERKRIEDEEEAMRILNEWYEQKVQNRDDFITELTKTVEERDKTIEEKDKTIEEDRKIIEEKDKENAELREKLAEMERLLRNKQVE